VRPIPCALLAGLTGLATAGLAAADEAAVYRVSGRDAALFDQYDNDGYSLQVSPGPGGGAELRVRVSDAPLSSCAAFPTARRARPEPPSARDRDAFVGRLTARAATQADAVRAVLVGLLSMVSYDPDRLRRQDPAAVFASGRAYCVGFSELAVDLLRRAGVSARTVQGILRTEPGGDGYESAIGGAYHRWIEVYYPDRGYVFSDPMRSINGVDARYIPFDRRTLARPRDLKLTAMSIEGSLGYESLSFGGTTVRLRRSAR
jgi:transglutaminase-like putative cysteine protease